MFGFLLYHRAGLNTSSSGGHTRTGDLDIFTRRLAVIRELWVLRGTLSVCLDGRRTRTRWEDISLEEPSCTKYMVTMD